MINLINIEIRINNCNKRINCFEKNSFDKIFQTIHSLKKEIGILKSCKNDLEKVVHLNEDEFQSYRQI